MTQGQGPGPNLARQPSLVQIYLGVKVETHIISRCWGWENNQVSDGDPVLTQVMWPVLTMDRLEHDFLFSLLLLALVPPLPPRHYTTRTGSASVSRTQSIQRFQQLHCAGHDSNETGIFLEF